MTAKTIAWIMLLLAVSSALCLGYYRYTFLDGDLDGVRDWFKDTFILITGVALFFVSADRLDHAKRADRIGFLERAWLHTDNAYLEWREYVAKFVDMGEKITDIASEEYDVVNNHALLAAALAIGSKRSCPIIKYINTLPSEALIRKNMDKQSITLIFRLKPRSSELAIQIEEFTIIVVRYIDSLQFLAMTSAPPVGASNYEDYALEIYHKSIRITSLFREDLNLLESRYTDTRDTQLS